MNDCIKRIEDLKNILEIQRRIVGDKHSLFYKCSLLKQLNKKITLEIDRLEELIYNGEVE